MQKFIFHLLLLSSFSLLAQDYVEPKEILYIDKVYENNIRTVTLKPASDPFGLPILKLGGRDRLILDFDQLGMDMTNYNYTVVHCTHDWLPSDLLKSEYIAGMQSYYIQDYDFSINTYVPYTHYSVTIPNNNLQLTKSGNYVLIVFQNDNPEDVVLTRRFMVYEELVDVAGKVVRATRVEDREEKQQLNFNVIHRGYDIPNPYIDIHVTAIQNGRWDNALLDLKPKFVRNDLLEFNFEGENSFWGGNEFRSFDTKQLTELTINVRKTVLDSNYTAFLIPEEPRNSDTYSVLPDADGRFVVRRLNSTQPDFEADYAWINFFLATPKLEYGDVYVFGALSDWQVKKRFLLTYDENTNAYRGSVLLKQGYYNYEYVLLPHGSNVADETELEGSHWQTTNEYTIFVYHREIGIRYDRLIGIQQIIDRPF